MRNYLAFDYEKEVCQDQYVADLIVMNSKYKLLPKIPSVEKKSIFTGFGITYNKSDYVVNFYNQVLYKKYMPAKTMVVVLESPHKEEYFYKKSTGVLVGSRKFFYEHFERLIQASKNLQIPTCEIYKIVLVNVIPFQCSLGLNINGKNKDIKETNLADCFSQEKFKNYFIERLTKLSPDIIINLCTGINGGIAAGMQAEAEAVINNLGYKYGNNYTRGTHPSFWGRGKAYIN